MVWLSAKNKIEAKPDTFTDVHGDTHGQYSKVYHQSISCPYNTRYCRLRRHQSIHTSSKFTLWPVLLSITRLPPHLRMNKDYILLAGVWLGPQKPPPTIILTSPLEELQHLHAVGLDVSTPERRKQVQVKLLLTVIFLQKPWCSIKSSTTDSILATSA